MDTKFNKRELQSVGETELKVSKFKFSWKIKNFLSIKVKKILRSPNFKDKLSNIDWYIQLSEQRNSLVFQLNNNTNVIEYNYSIYLKNNQNEMMLMTKNTNSSRCNFILSYGDFSQKYSCLIDDSVTFYVSTQTVYATINKYYT